MKAPAPPFPPRGVAAHVAAAMSSLQQAKSAAAPRAVAAHVQAAVGSLPVQARLAPPTAPTVAPTWAAHVQRAVQAGLQAKRPPAAPAPARPSCGRAAPRPSPPLRPARPGAASLQRMSESLENKALEVVKAVSSTFKHGPGNQSISSSKARKRMALTEYLMGKLRDKMEISSGTARALVRGQRGIEKSDFLRLGLRDQIEFEQENAKTIAELRDLAMAVYFDVAAKKARGGSCDHTSAGTFLELAGIFGDNAKVKLVRFKPDKSSFEPPSSELAYHRAVLLNDDLVLDPWNPGKKVEKLEKLKEKDAIETVVEWNESAHRSFVDNLRIELENKLPGLEEEYGYYKKEADLDKSVTAIWKVV